MKKLISTLLIALLMLSACTKRPSVAPPEESSVAAAAAEAPVPAEAPAQPDTAVAESKPQPSGPAAEPGPPVTVVGHGISDSDDAAQGMNIYIDFRNNTGGELTQIYFDFEVYDNAGALLLIGQNNTNQGGVAIDDGRSLRVQISLPAELSVIRLNVTKYITAAGEEHEIPKEDVVPVSLDFEPVKAG